MAKRTSKSRSNASPPRPNASRRAGANGVEITASKGYLVRSVPIPSPTGARTPMAAPSKNVSTFWTVVQAARPQVGRDSSSRRTFSAGLQLLAAQSAVAHCFPARSLFHGQHPQGDAALWEELKLSASTISISTVALAFPIPREARAAYPRLRLFLNATRHLSAKAWVRASLMNLTPGFVARALFGIGWRFKAAANAKFAAAFKKEVSIPIIANGGFQSRKVIERRSPNPNAIWSPSPVLFSPIPICCNSFSTATNRLNPAVFSTNVVRGRRCFRSVAISGASNLSTRWPRRSLPCPRPSLRGHSRR